MTARPTRRDQIRSVTKGTPNRPLTQLRRALAPRGRLVIIGGETGGRWLDGTDRQIRPTVMSRFTRQSMGTFINSEAGTDLCALAESGAVPLVDSVYSLDRAVDALRHLIDGHPRGQIVVSVS